MRRALLLILFYGLIFINLTYYTNQHVLSYIMNKISVSKEDKKSPQDWKQTIASDPAFKEVCSWYLSPVLIDNNSSGKNGLSEAYILGKIEADYWKKKYQANKSYVMSDKERKSLHEAVLNRYFEFTGRRANE